MGVETAFGSGLDALARGLRAGRVALAREQSGPLEGALLGRCTPEDTPGRDRTLVLLDSALSQVHRATDAVRAQVGPDRMGIAAGVSKGGVLGFLADGRAQASWLARLLPQEPACCLARELGLRGPATARVAACATGLHNLAAACDWVARGECDAALAACSEATLHPLYYASFQAMRLIAPDGCRPFDAARAGMTISEGSAVFLITTPATANAAGLPTLARVAGWSIGADASGPTTVDAAARGMLAACRRALAMAGTRPDEFDLLQCHATGTLQNDAAEARLSRELNAGAVPVNGLKGALGHAMGAAAGIEAAACVAMLRDGFLAGTAGFESLAPDCAGIRVQAAPTAHPVRRVLKVSLGFGGQLGALVLEAG